MRLYSTRRGTVARRYCNDQVVTVDMCNTTVLEKATEVICLCNSDKCNGNSTTKVNVTDNPTTKANDNNNPTTKSNDNNNSTTKANDNNNSTTKANESCTVKHLVELTFVMVILSALFAKQNTFIIN
jgi:hypothetical protein